MVKSEVLCIKESEMAELNYLFALYELVAKKLGKSIWASVKDAKFDNTKLAISLNLAKAWERSFTKKGILDKVGFNLVMQDAGPQIDATLPDNTVVVYEGLFE